MRRGSKPELERTAARRRVRERHPAVVEVVVRSRQRKVAVVIDRLHLTPLPPLARADQRRPGMLQEIVSSADASRARDRFARMKRGEDDT
jgi:hypothetical protein